MRFLIPAFLMLTLLTANCTPVVAQKIVAHRGASYDAPENTLAAFTLAWKMDADAIEGDFYLTADQKIVCIHDKTTKRTAAVDRDIATSTYEELCSIDVGSWKGPEFAEERIATLEQVLHLVPANKTFLIEIKCGPEIVPVLTEVLKQNILPFSQIRIICFDAEVIAACKKSLPEIKAFWLTSFRQDKRTKEWSPSAEVILQTMKRIECDGLDARAEREVVTKNFIQQVKSAGYEFHIWTVNDPKDADHFSELGVDSITTDRPDLLSRVLESAE